MRSQLDAAFARSDDHWIPLSDLMTGLMMVFLLVAIGSGWWYFYNAHVLNEYLTAKDRRDIQAAYERDFILKKLDENHGNVSRTAEALGLERSHLYRKMKSLGIAAKE